MPYALTERQYRVDVHLPESNEGHFLSRLGRALGPRPTGAATTWSSAWVSTPSVICTGSRYPVVHADRLHPVAVGGRTGRDSGQTCDGTTWSGSHKVTIAPRQRRSRRLLGAADRSRTWHLGQGAYRSGCLSRCLVLNPRSSPIARLTRIRAS